MRILVWSLLTLLLEVVSTSARPQFPYHPWIPGYTPDYVLTATAENVTINCISRYSVVFNGSVPGPPLHLRENHTTWIRVYNNISDQNLTVVSLLCSLLPSRQQSSDTLSNSIGTVFLNGLTSSRTARHKSLSGPLHLSTTSTML